MDLSQYRDLFLAEAREYLQSLTSLLLLLEESPEDQDHINALFRAAHSLKGMAASMEYHTIAELAHGMENLMNRVREREFPFERTMAAVLLEGADLIELFLEKIAAEKPFDNDVSPLLQRLAGYSPPEESQDTCDTPDRKISGIQEPAINLAHQRPAVRETFPTVRVRAELLDRLIDTTGELFTARQRIHDQSRGTSNPLLDDSLKELSRLLGDLHRIVMKVRLMPFASLTERFPRVVRELANKSGKEISFTIEGKDIELDRGVLEELADPLVHIMRNAVDHGIETPSERKVAGKEPFGRIKLAARRDKDHAVISVIDDGRGMDPRKLAASAVAKGLLSEDDAAALSRNAAFMLTCIPGFSTAATVTDISGRGVGMDAVRSKIQSLGGTLAIESEINMGTKMLLRVPVNVTIINLLLLSVCGLKFAVPATMIQRTVELGPARIVKSGDNALIVIDNEEIPLRFFHAVLGCEDTKPLPSYIPIILAEVSGRLTGFAVDRVLGQREMHVKPLGRPLNMLPWLAGTALLGDGEIIYVLDPESLA